MKLGDLRRIAGEFSFFMDDVDVKVESLHEEHELMPEAMVRWDDGRPTIVLESVATNPRRPNARNT